MQNWSQLWLQYRPIEDKQAVPFLQTVSINDFDANTPILQNALQELERGLKGMLGVNPTLCNTNDATLRIQRLVPAKSCGREQCHESDLQSVGTANSSCCVVSGSYHIKESQGRLTLSASDESGVLYGIFEILRRVALVQSFTNVDYAQTPDNELRMLNHWDNVDGSIERGYSGNSFFFEERDIVLNERIVDYARIVASVGINAVVVNNVNVKQEATYFITDRYVDKIAKLSDIFEGYGISLYLSLNYAASDEFAQLGADPLDPAVRQWWQAKMKEVYQAVPHLGGFLVKADSEGRPGPFTYGRTQADGANMLAEAIAPYGGLIIWRCFVYNCTQDWRDRKTDRARAGYDNFIELDGQFADNAILQIKNGPMDFQIREPVSPLLGAMSKTNQILELQIAQEYTGQQIDVCYLIPMYKEVLDFHTYAKANEDAPSNTCNAVANSLQPDVKANTYALHNHNANVALEKMDTVADIVARRTFGNPHGGIAAVCNTGRDYNWTGNDLAAANLYGYGRLIFNTKMTAEDLAKEWAGLTFSTDTRVVETICKILLPSRAIYEKYTAPLGIGWMVFPETHYGPGVDGYEYSRWGTYHYADFAGLGVDRTDNGTAYVRQYHEPNASMYNALEDCPEELLLFFHHVPYLHQLKSGKTVIQHIYDSHFEGAEAVEELIRLWDSLENDIPKDAFERVQKRFLRQRKNAAEWRDQVNTYFYRKTGIEDEHKRKFYL